MSCKLETERKWWARGPEEDRKIKGQTKVDPSAEDSSFLSKRWLWLTEIRWPVLRGRSGLPWAPLPCPKGAGSLGYACRMEPWPSSEKGAGLRGLLRTAL